LNSLGVGRIHKSKNSKFKEGQIVRGALDWAEYTLVSDVAKRMIEGLENKYDIPWSAFTGILGMPGFTAYSYCALTPFQGWWRLMVGD
jgi:NADPH-dependent curcumin reductase CurA